jgi:hypothetical protein
MPNLAPTSFQTGPDDVLDVVDVYNQLGQSTLNSIQNATGSIQSAEMGFLNRKPVLSAEMSGMLNDRILTVKNGKLSVDFNAVIRTLINTNPTLLAAYRGLGTAYQTTMANVKAIENLIEVSVGGVRKIIRSIEYGDISSLAAMTLQLATGSPEIPNFLFKDLGGLTYLANKLIVEAATIGLTGIYRPLTTSSTFAGEPMRALTRALINPIVNLADHELLLEVCSNGGGAYILQARPSFIQDFMANYKAQYASQSECFKATGRYMDSEWANVQSAFDLMDPNWMLASRFGDNVDAGPVMDLSAMMNAPDQAFEALRQHSLTNAPDYVASVLQVGDAATPSDLRRINCANNLENSYYLGLMQRMPRYGVATALKRAYPLDIRLSPQ